MFAMMVAVTAAVPTEVLVSDVEDKIGDVYSDY